MINSSMPNNTSSQNPKIPDMYKELTMIKDLISILSQKLNSTENKISVLNGYNVSKTNQLEHLSKIILQLCDFIEKISTKVRELDTKISRLENPGSESEKEKPELDSDYTTDLNKVRVTDIKKYLKRLEEKYKSYE